MKRFFLFSITVLFFFSCTEEDGITLNGTPLRTELDIVKIIETTYTSGSPSAINVSIFTDRRKKSDSLYNENRELRNYTKWNYNLDTLLVSIEKFDSLHVLLPEKSYYFSYNEEKKIDTIKNSIKTISYNYDNSNLILASYSNITEKDSIFLNSDNAIFKISNGLVKTEVTNITNVSSLKETLITSNTDITTANYSYNTVISPKGYLYSDTMKKTFKNSNNAILFFSLIQAYHIYSENYLAYIYYNGEENVIGYILDENSYLKESNHSVNGDYRTRKEYFFE